MSLLDIIYTYNIILNNINLNTLFILELLFKLKNNN